MPQVLAPVLMASWTAGACSDFNTTRSPAPRGTLGEEMFGVVCDRLGGQSLHEDLTGASYHDVCHRGAEGSFSDRVDQAKLPPLIDNSQDIQGKPVPLAQQTADRGYGVARLQTLARHRADVIAALDATFPTQQVSVVDPSCAAAGQDSFHAQLADLLGRLGPLYDDGTIPQSTEALAGVINAFHDAQDARAAWARMNARAGYRPVDLALGVARPSLGYPKLRDWTSATLKLLSPDSNPYDPNAQPDSSGNRVPVPGSAHDQLTKVLETAQAELANATANDLAPLSSATDPGIARVVLSRARTNVEFLRAIASAQDPAYGSSTTSGYIVQRDARGYAVVPLLGGALPAPFQKDPANPLLPALDSLGQFETANGQPAPSPFLTLDFAAASSPGSGSHDAYGRTLTAQNDLVYGYVDTNHTYLASLTGHLKPLLDATPNAQHETLMDAAAGAYVLLGTRDGSNKSSTRYADGSVVLFDAFHPAASPIADLVYALGQLLADPSIDATLALSSTLMSQNANDVARVAGDALYSRSLAVADTSGHLPATSTLWDEIIDVTIQIAQEPGLLEDVLLAFGNDATAHLGESFAVNMSDLDVMSYDRASLNGPVVNTTTKDPSTPKTPVNRSRPDSGANRSEMQRFVQTIHDTNGVTMCNKEGAIVHARGVLAYTLNADACATSASGAGNTGTICTLDNNCCPSNCGSAPVCANARPFRECEVFKIDNLARFYLDSIVGKATLYFRPLILRDGICIGGQTPPCAGATTVGVVEESSGIGFDPATAGAPTPTTPADTYNDTDPTKPGFWDSVAADSYLNAAQNVYGLRPKPSWLGRLVNFDLANDSPTSSSTGNNYPTNHFLSDLQGAEVGTTVCPERIIPDPCNNDATCAPAPPANAAANFANATAGVSSDGMVHGLRSCQDGDWLYQRDADVTFVNETNGFYQAVTPLANAFAAHNREDLFLGLMEVLHKHWQSSQGTASECKLFVDANGNTVNCSKDGADSYEPLLSEIFSTDLFTALNHLVKIAESVTIPTCGTIDSMTHLCTKTGMEGGIGVLADATRALVDPTRAAFYRLVDSHAGTTSQRNDGTTNAQVTPLYLVLETLNEMDQAFTTYAAANPQDTGRLAQWRRARSQLVDELLKVNGENTTTQSFADPALAKITPVLVDTLRAQILANCGGDPVGQCTWARSMLYKKFTDMISTRPLFSAAIDLGGAIRQDDAARTQTEALLTYLLSDPNAIAEILASGTDLLQVLDDDSNLVPLYHVLAEAAAPTQKDANGNVRRGVVDATTAMLLRMEGRAYDASGHAEICSSELDPNNVLKVALANLVTPMPLPGCTPTSESACAGQTPLEYIVDAIADVNRLSPGSTTATTNLGTKLTDGDYANMSHEVYEFFADQQRGLEQFYEVVRRGTTPQ